MRRAILVTALLALAACSGGPAAPSPSPSRPVASSPGTSATPSAASPSVEPLDVPDGVPVSYGSDIDAADVPPEALVPSEATVTDVWYAEAAAGSSIVVAYVEAGSDPFRQAHALVVWRRFPGRPEPWRPVFGLSDPAGRGVLQIHAIVGDATGDGSVDALTFEDTGGSGACGTWRVLDLTANAEVFRRKTCDTMIDLSTDPSGLATREAVFAPDDAHCCPSSMRVSTLTYDGSPFAWTTVSSSVEPT